tara:strand:- start:448 stop:1425 length:978 start_codon:yes stop_codon:yes gene_type:complete
MSNFDSFFNNDPWSDIPVSSYPEGRRLYEKDRRFWVSINEFGQVLFFIDAKNAENVASLVNLDGVDIRIDNFKNDYYRLVCTLTIDDTDIKEKFSVIAKDVAHHCSSYDGVDLFVKVQERIMSWANFLKPTRTGLTQAEFVGFWGELYTVSRLFMKLHSPADVVRFWVGPEGKKQDITLNAMAFEVKTSISGDPRTIKISSVEQLERTTDFLYLLHLVANPSDSESAVSLELLYQECLESLSHDLNAEILFLQKTSELYGKASDHQLSELFSILSISLFDVNEDFPFITRNEIKQGVSAVQYEVLISSLKEFEVTKSIEEIIKNG